MMPLIAFDVDYSSINRALDLAAEETTRTLRSLLESTAFHVAVKTQRYTPFVTTAKIDSDLNVVTTPRLATQGKRKGQPLKSGKKDYFVPSQSAATRIVLASLHAGSKFNRLTGHRWYRDPRTFSPGKGAIGFWEQVNVVAQRMVAARHSSTHFLQASWGVIAKKLRGKFYAAPPSDFGVIDIDASVTQTGDSDDFGEVYSGGSANDWSVTLSNLLGMRASTHGGDNAANINEAMLRHSLPAAQRALNEQAAEMETRYRPRAEARITAAFNSVK